MAESAIRSSKTSVPGACRLLLLLAIQNADKAAKPASFEHRLAMMSLFGQELYDQTQSPVDIAVTKEPYFHHKAAAIDKSTVYPGEVEQVYLTGFDTLIRLFNTKYYPPEHKLTVLEPFLSRHRVRVTYRTETDKQEERRKQRKYVSDIGDGKRDDEGAKPEWADRIELVEGRRDGERIVSSTLARKAAKSSPEELKDFVTKAVEKYVKDEKLYLEDD